MVAVDLTAEEAATVNKIVGRFDHANDGLHQHWRERWDEYAGLYHNYNRAKEALKKTGPRDRDSLAGDIQKEFGDELFIPHTFSTVELIVARTLATPPRMIVNPGQEEAEAFTEHVRCLIGQQQSNINYELVVQAVGKSGHIFNLGIQKVSWRREERLTTQAQKIAGQWIVGAQPQPELLFNGPNAEYVSPYDFIWDPIATEIADMGWCVHRTWRGDEYVLRKLGLLDGQDPSTAEWRALEGRLTAEDIRGMGSRNTYGDAMAGRLDIQGLNSPTVDERADNIHEVWECHDPVTRQVVILLDRLYPVAEAEAPNWRGELPFQAYRPTWVPDQFVGKGSIEPIVGLQRETNMLRSNRMWNLLLKLHTAYAYDDGLVDPDDIRIGPGALVGVNGNPEGLLKELLPGDIPPSSFQEEQAMIADFFRTTGLGDPTEPVQGGGETATGIQLVQAATQARVKLTTLRARLEIVKPAARQWHQMNKQKILSDPAFKEKVSDQGIRQPAGPSEEYPDRRWSWLKVAPEELALDYEIDVDAGLEAENVAQDRQDGEKLMQLASDPRFDGERFLTMALRRFGVKNAEQYIRTAPPGVPVPAVFQIAKDLRIPVEIATVLAQECEKIAAQQVGGGGG